MSLLLLFSGGGSVGTATLVGTVVDLRNMVQAGLGLTAMLDAPEGRHLTVGGQIAVNRPGTVITDAGGDFGIAIPPASAFTPAGPRLRVTGPSDLRLVVPLPVSGSVQNIADAYGSGLSGAAAQTCTVSGTLINVHGHALPNATLHFGLDVPAEAVVRTTDKSLVLTKPVSVETTAFGTFSIPLLRAASLVPTGVKVWVRGPDGLFAHFVVPNSASVDLSTLL